MPRKQLNCGICGAPAVGEVIEQEIPAQGVSEAYIRVVHAECEAVDREVAEEVAAERAAAESEAGDE